MFYAPFLDLIQATKRTSPKLNERVTNIVPEPLGRDRDGKTTLTVYTIIKRLLAGDNHWITVFQKYRIHATGSLNDCGAVHRASTERPG